MRGYLKFGLYRIRAKILPLGPANAVEEQTNLLEVVFVFKLLEEITSDIGGHIKDAAQPVKKNNLDFFPSRGFTLITFFIITPMVLWTSDFVRLPQAANRSYGLPGESQSMPAPVSACF